LRRLRLHFPEGKFIQGLFPIILPKSCSVSLIYKALYHARSDTGGGPQVFIRRFEIWLCKLWTRPAVVMTVASPPSSAGQPARVPLAWQEFQPSD
jgi:hypothetical protein